METIQDADFARRYLKRNLIGLAPVVLGFILLWIDRGQLSGLDFWLAILSFAVGVGYFAIKERCFLNSYRCPRCDRLLKQTSDGCDEPLAYTCDDCEVRWKIGA